MTAKKRGTVRDRDPLLDALLGLQKTVHENTRAIETRTEQIHIYAKPLTKTDIAGAFRVPENLLAPAPPAAAEPTARAENLSPRTRALIEAASALSRAVEVGGDGHTIKFGGQFYVPLMRLLNIVRGGPWSAARDFMDAQERERATETAAALVEAEAKLRDREAQLEILRKQVRDLEGAHDEHVALRLAIRRALDGPA